MVYIFRKGALSPCPLRPHPHSLSRWEREASRSAPRAHFFTLGEGELVKKMEALTPCPLPKGEQKFISGEWGVELEGYEATQAKDKQDAEQQARAWRK